MDAGWGEGALSTALHADGSLGVAGEIDNVTAPEFERALRDAIERSDGDVVIDVSGVRFMDSSGINVLVRCFKVLDAGERTLVLRRPSRAVRLVVEASGLSPLLRLE